MASPEQLEDLIADLLDGLVRVSTDLSAGKLDAKDPAARAAFKSACEQALSCLDALGATQPARKAADSFAWPRDHGPAVLERRAARASAEVARRKARG